MPLVPSALSLCGRFCVDRVPGLVPNKAEVGVYSAAGQIASVITFVMIAFRTAWRIAFRSRTTARRRTYTFVLTYLLAFASGPRLRSGPRAVVDEAAHLRVSTRREGRRAARVRGAVYAGYTVLAIGSGRARKTQLNWVVTGVGAAANIGLNFWLIPRWGMVGAAISTLAAYVVLFFGMTLYAQRVYPVAYQWRRVATAVGAAVALTVAARAAHLSRARRCSSCARTRSHSRCSAICRPSGSGALAHADRLEPAALIRLPRRRGEHQHKTAEHGERQEAHRCRSSLPQRRSTSTACC
jgi:hypothetical protein